MPVAASSHSCFSLRFPPPRAIIRDLYDLVPAGPSLYDPYPGSWYLEVFCQELDDRPIGQSLVGWGSHGDTKPVVLNTGNARVAGPRCHMHRYPHVVGLQRCDTYAPCGQTTIGRGLNARRCGIPRLKRFFRWRGGVRDEQWGDAGGPGRPPPAGVAEERL